MEIPKRWIDRLQDYKDLHKEAIDSGDIVKIRVSYSSLEGYLGSLK